MSSSMFRVWVAGPRAWENPKPIEIVMRRLVANYGIGRLLVMEGGAPGVDRITKDVCRALNVHVFECAATWPIGRKAGPIRNGIIAKEFAPDLLIAFHYFPLDLTNHPGTQNAIKQARRYHIRVKTIQVKPATALPSSASQSSPLGNAARLEQGLPPKQKKVRRKRPAA